jgi:hypothetical protein
MKIVSESAVFGGNLGTNCRHVNKGEGEKPTYKVLSAIYAIRLGPQERDINGTLL